MPGAELGFLADEFEVWRSAGFANRFAAVAVDHANACGLERAGSIDHVREQRLARERVQDLRRERVHALAHSGRKHHDV
jgi:hypothetical protein